MIIGRFVIKKAKTIKKILLTSEKGSNEQVFRMLQIYSCRFCGLCIYRNEKVYFKEKDEIFNCL